MKKYLIPLVSIAFFLLVWQLLALWIDKPMLFPALDGLFVAIGKLLLSIRFYVSLLVTLLRGLAGMLLSLGLVVVFSFLFVRAKWLYELFRPILAFMRSVPVISFILLALIFMHAEGIPLLIGFLVMFPLLTENLMNGLQNLDPGLNRLSDQFLIGHRNHQLLITYPQLKPFLYSGLASAMGFGWRAIIMGEVLAQTTFGIGGEMKKAQSFIDVPELIVWTLIAVFIGYLSDKGIGRLSRLKFPLHFVRSTPEKESLRLSSQHIRLKGVEYRYGVFYVNYEFQQGKIYGISAPSGAGKTTLLNLISGILTPTAGTVVMDRSYGVAFVFQELALLDELTAIENVMLPLAQNHTKAMSAQLAAEMLKEMDMEALSDKYPEELSFGQQQRVAIARALAYPSPFLFMDEPFKGIDDSTRNKIINYIKEQQSVKQQIVIFTSHQSEELELADVVLTPDEIAYY
ncbi:ATP-binding cassette domain-containing protein [Parabacteroides sp. OttesenSCG-928-G07]|nr:ATP-binding cassette domain-containing protein [Parabacteroides sp. OttesenSCG-928-G21]MDL2277286.1 ATP-binding cassette domain-containing protein [Parabacteroides sp. OttesenSCG-928-G07]